MPPRVYQRLRDRAGHRCEYCRLPQVASRLTFHIDHVIARQHGGVDSLQNLALACTFCNGKKGPNIASLDPADGRLMRLYSPRSDRWPDHFAWAGWDAIGLSAVGRTTVFLLAMNDPIQLARRQAAEEVGLFPFPP